MSNALHLLADLGAASVGTVWAPVLAWTLIALVAEGALRAARASARVGLGVRGALVALLPLLLAVPAVLARWVPSLRRATLPPAPLADPSAVPLAAVPVAPSGVATVTPLADLASPPVLDVLMGAAVVLGVVAGLVALGVLAGGLVWLHRYRRTLGAASGAVAAEARALADRLGARGVLAVAESEPASAPFTVGWRRPVVAVPPDLDGDALSLALAHEIAHVREAHYGWGLAERAVRAAFVWHPLLHVLGRGLALDRERAADAAVLGLWPDRARRYGELLRAIAARPAPSLALAASSSTLVYRLTAMTRPSPDRRRLARLAGALVLSVPLLLAAAAVPDAPAARAATPATPRAVSPAVDLSVTAPASAAVPAGTSPVAAPDLAPADTLDPDIQSRTVDVQDGNVTVDVVLGGDATRARAEEVARQLSIGAEPGTIRVRYIGGNVVRSILGRGVTSETSESPTNVAGDLRQMAAQLQRGLREMQPAIEEVERQVEILRAELVAVDAEIYELRDEPSRDFQGNPIPRRPEVEARYIRLDARRDIIVERYRRAVRDLETRRIDALLSDD